MAKRKPIKVKYGKIKELQRITGAGRTTIWQALRWNSDTEKENRIRQLAKDLGFIRKF